MKHYCLIDGNGLYLDFVREDYDAPEGFKKVDAPAPFAPAFAGADGYLKARWNGESWEESATKAEIEKFESDNPAPENVEITDPLLEIEMALAELAELIAGMMEV